MMLHAENRLVRHFDPEHACRDPDAFELRVLRLCDDLDAIGATRLTWLLKAGLHGLSGDASRCRAARLATLEQVERDAFEEADTACAARARDPRGFRVAIRGWLAVADACNELRGSQPRRV